MRKKGEAAVVFLALAGMIAFLLFGIFGDGNNAEEGTDTEATTIYVWGGVPENAGPSEVIEAFNEEFEDSGIRAEYCYFANNETGNRKLENALQTGRNIDVYFSYDVAALYGRANSDLAEDLTGYLTEDGIDLRDYYNMDVTAYYIDGRPYGVPTKIDQYGIVVNKDMFEAAGIEIPDSWNYDEFREIAKQLTHEENGEKVYGMFFCTQQNLGYLLDFIAPCSMGTNFLINKETGESDFLRPEMVELAEMVNAMMNIDGSAPSHVDSVTQKLTQESMFLSGRCAMTIGPWIIREVKNTEDYPHDFTTAFVPYPVADSAEETYSCGSLGDFLSINPNSWNKDEAWTFIKWYTTEGILPMVSGGGRIPAYKGFDTEEIMEYLMRDAEDLLDEESARKVLVEAKDNYAVLAVTPGVSDLYTIAREELEQIFIGNKTAVEGMTDAKARGDAVLEENSSGG